MPQPTVPAPRTPQFASRAACAHCGTTAEQCADRRALALRGFELRWEAGQHLAQASHKYLSDPQAAYDEARARTENGARCCAGCTMHGYSR